jgi:hypothetical protein
MRCVQDEIVGCSWQKLVAPGEASRLLHLVIPFLKRFNKTYSPVLTIQPRCLTKDGTIFKYGSIFTSLRCDRLIPSRRLARHQRSCTNLRVCASQSGDQTSVLLRPCGPVR